MSNAVVERRLEYWPNDETRAEAARLYARGRTLGEVLAQFPDEVPDTFRGEWHDAIRRAIWAHYSLIQELVGEPDLDPDSADDLDVMAQILRDHHAREGIVWVKCRAGAHLGDLLGNSWPDRTWYKNQAPASWL